MKDTQLLLHLAHLIEELTTIEHTHTNLHSPKPTTHTTQHNTNHLPFGLDRTHSDNPDNPADNKTAAGILLWATQWTQHFETWYGRNLNAALPYLAQIAPTAAQGHPDDWNELMNEARPIWTRTARTCGYLPEPAGQCWCGATLFRDPTDHGLTDHMVCDGPAEHWYADHQHYTTEYQRNARLITTPGRMLTTHQIHTIWPTLDRRTLHSWATRGHVTKDQAGRYDLAQVNTRMQNMAA